MKIVTPEQMREIDKHTINEIGIPGIVLMENAANAIVSEIQNILSTLKNKSIIVFAGKGNNGGDALAAARLLYNKGAKVKVYLLTEKASITGDSLINLKILDNLELDMVEATNENQLSGILQSLSTADMVIDGIFGTGLKGEIKGFNKEIINIINSSSKYVLAIDIPSGTCGLTGKILGASVKAYKTVTLCLPKVGLISNPGAINSGELVVADISIPEASINRVDIKTRLITPENVAEMIPERYTDSNKGDYGRVFILSGSTGMTGAGCLAAGAALRAGSGLVYLGVPGTLSGIYNASMLEAITIPLEDEGKGVLSKRSIDVILKRCKKMDVAAIGPGLSTGSDISEIVAEIIKKLEIPLVIDADGLNALCGRLEILKNHPQDIVITPHPGEFSRLLGISIEDVQNNRMETAIDFSRKYNVITVLKGSRTIIADQYGNTYINPTGNSGMATAGTGDVLTGIISGLMAQGASPIAASVSGVYLHGRAGDNAADTKGEYGLIAGDLINELPGVIKGIKGKSKLYL